MYIYRYSIIRVHGHGDLPTRSDCDRCLRARRVGGAGIVYDVAVGAGGETGLEGVRPDRDVVVDGDKADCAPTEGC